MKMIEQKENKILSYFHCKKCLNGKLAVGFTEKGLQMFCEDCNTSVLSIDLEGQKIKLIEVD